MINFASKSISKSTLAGSRSQPTLSKFYHNGTKYLPMLHLCNDDLNWILGSRESGFVVIHVGNFYKKRHLARTHCKETSGSGIANVLSYGNNDIDVVGG